MVLKSLSTSCSLNCRLTKFRNKLLCSFLSALISIDNMHGEFQYPSHRVLASRFAPKAPRFYVMQTSDTPTHKHTRESQLRLCTTKNTYPVLASFYIHTYTLRVCGRKGLLTIFSLLPQASLSTLLDGPNPPHFSDGYHHTPPAVMT